jgi:general secretion pathway protein J
MNMSIRLITMNKLKSNGFTLIEVLVALMIFAILGTLSTYAMQKLIQSYANIKTNHQQWINIDNVIHDIDNELKHFVRRPISAQSNRQFPAIIGQPDYLEWTYSTHAEKLQRTALLCKDKQLIRRDWPILDPINRNQYHETVLLNGLSECRFRYLGRDHKVSGFWEQSPKKSPKGVALMLKWSNHQSLNMWFSMAPYYYVA